MQNLQPTTYPPSKIFAKRKFGMTGPQANRGYSLVELMVAVAIFTIVAMVAVSALISINDANKKAQTMRAIIDNLNFAVENMARNMRVGTNYHCGDELITPSAATTPADCPNNLEGGIGIAFKSYTGNNVAYRLNNLGQIEKSDSSWGSGVWLPISPHIDNPMGNFQPLTIDYLRFYVIGASSSGQPRVVMVVRGIAKYNNKIQTQFNIETSVSQRKLDSL